MRKLLEVTRLSPADQTDARLLLDKADQIATMIKKDGSWGMHAQNYLLDQVKILPKPSRSWTRAVTTR